MLQPFEGGLQGQPKGKPALPSGAGLWNQGACPHFCDTRESPPVYGVLVFGKPFVVSQKWSFPTTLIRGNHWFSPHGILVDVGFGEQTKIES